MEAKRILIVDDDKDVLDSFREILELEGFKVDTAETGGEAVEKSKTSFYNLALLDIRLPDMEGTELLTKMRETTPKMIKIMVTGYPSLHNAVEAVNKGADGYVTKPILNMSEFINMIKEHLKKQEEAKKYSEQKVVEYVEARAREQQTSNNKKPLNSLHKPGSS